MCCGQKRSQLQTTPAPRRAGGILPSVPANRQGQVVRTRPSPPLQTGTVSPDDRVSLPSRSVPPPPPVPTSTPPASIAIRYLETSPVRVQGLVTGRRYEFSASQSVQSVDARDVSPLLNTRFFSRA